MMHAYTNSPLSLLLFSSFFFSVLFTFEAARDHDPCTKDHRCGHHSPPVRFPFRLEGQHPPGSCAYLPQFNLSCSGSDLMISLPNASNRLVVKKIDYRLQTISVSDPEKCLPFKLRSVLNGSDSHVFTVVRTPTYPQYSYSDGPFDYPLFSCPPPTRQSMLEVPCKSDPGGSYNVYAVLATESVGNLPLMSCQRNGSAPSLPNSMDSMMVEVQLNWTQPDCGRCEKMGQRCRLWKSGITRTVCEPGPSHGPRDHEIEGGVIFPFFLLLGLTGLGYVVYERRRRKAFQAKIENFLHDYRCLKPTRYTYNDIKRITNEFEEMLGQGSYGKVYKGKLSSEIFVAVKMLDNSIGKGEEFINEVGTMGRIHHVNVVRLVGFCADGFRRALVYEFLPNESLEKYIFPADDALDSSLSWERLHEIAVGVAKGIEYLHQGCDHRILHFDIKPHNILLDNDFTPKIADFGLAKLCSKEQSAVSMTAARGTMGYIAPEVFSRNFGSVSYKSDVYSFGMLLLEMVGGRKNVDVEAKDMSQMYFPQWVYNHLNKGEELEIRIREDGDRRIAKKLGIIGLWCIQWSPADRPSMNAVVQMLETEESPDMPRNPFVSSGSGDVERMPGRQWNTNLEVIAE